MPYEFHDLDAVHILPLVDLGRLLVVLVARSIELSNTQYSLLLENEGRLLNLGSEWIGARVQYHKRAVCFSEMLASDDFEYTDYWGMYKDECEYFINAFASNDRIYLQSYVFDTTFELEMDFENIEIRYNQLYENNKIHVSSNPYFVFHDDVFPTYVKNQFSQKKFSRQAENKMTIVPDNYFVSLAFFDHISTFELESEGAYIISFVLKIDNKILLSPGKILELQFTDGKTMLSVEFISDGGVQYRSCFIVDQIIDDKIMSNEERSFFVKLDFETFSITVNDADKNWRNQKDYKFNISDTDEFNKKAIKIYKYDQGTAIKNLVINRAGMSEDNILLIIEKIIGQSYLADGNRDDEEYFLISGDLSYVEKATLAAMPKSALHAVFKGHYPASSRCFSLAYQKSADCRNFLQI